MAIRNAFNIVAWIKLDRSSRLCLSKIEYVREVKSKIFKTYKWFFVHLIRIKIREELIADAPLNRFWCKVKTYQVQLGMLPKKY